LARGTPKLENLIVILGLLAVSGALYVVYNFVGPLIGALGAAFLVMTGLLSRAPYGGGRLSWPAAFLAFFILGAQAWASQGLFYNPNAFVFFLTGTPSVGGLLLLLLTNVGIGELFLVILAMISLRNVGKKAAI
jgi:hypothetical protein